MKVVESIQIPIGHAIATIEVGELGPKEIWDTKNDWNAYVAKSKEIWDSMTEQRQEGVVLIIKDAIERLYQKTPDWIPESLTTIESGRFLDVYFRILFTDVDTEVEREIQANSFRVREAFAEAMAAIEEFANTADLQTIEEYANQPESEATPNAAGD